MTNYHRSGYMKEYTKKRYAEDRAKAVELLGGKCSQCHSEKDLQFDHVMSDRTSRKSIVSLMLGRRKWEYIVEELEKCQLLCKFCHARKTVLDRGDSFSRHGTTSMYANQKCRCEDCRSAKAEYKRLYTQKNKEAIQSKL